MTDRDGRAVYAFDCLIALFPAQSGQIVHAQIALEAIHEKLQQFRNNVAFHSRSDISAHIAARRKLQDEDTYLDLVSAIKDFEALMEVLTAGENKAVPEFAETLERLGVQHHPAFVSKAK